MLRVLFVLLLVAGTLFAGYRLPHYLALDFFAILLSMLGGSLLGLALADGRHSRIAAEIVAVLIWMSCTLFGMWKWDWLIPSGYIGFGIWCLLHSNGMLGARIKTWYVSVYTLYAWLVAAYVLLRFFW